MSLSIITFLSHPVCLSHRPPPLPARKSKPRRMRKSRPRPLFTVTHGSFILFA